MNIQAEKLEILKLLLETKSESVVSAVKDLLTGSPNDESIWEALPSRDKKEILEGLREIESGLTVNYQKFMESHR